MADHYLLGIFPGIEQTTDAVTRLRDLGIPENKVTIISGIPYTHRILGRRKIYGRLGLIALVGAVLGALTALFFVLGTPLLYPIHVGGQPLYPIPPTIIITFELTMLGAMVVSFLGLLADSRLVYKGRQLYSARITEGNIGLLAQVYESKLDRARQVMQEAGAAEIQTEPVPEGHRRIPWSWLAPLVLIGLILVVLGGLVSYDILHIPVPSNMIDQLSVAYGQGPRLAAPAGSVPIQGPSLIAGQSPIEAVPSTSDSLQRGAFYYSITCQICHGAQGKGDGNIASYFNPPPADLTSDAAKSLNDNDIYVIITNGRGLMPSYRENLMPLDRWDVINFVRSLQK